MKLTKQELILIIQQELREVFRPTMGGAKHQRAYDRMKAGMDSDTIRKLSDLDATGNLEDQRAAFELANMLGSEEAPSISLKHKSMPLLYKGQQMIAKFVKGAFEGIAQMAPNRRIDWWENNGVNLDKYMTSGGPAPVVGEWEPIHITKEQMATNEQKFLLDHLWTTNWKNYKDSNGKPDRARFDAEWQKIAPTLLNNINKEIDKHIESGKIREINGILYNKI